MVLTAGVEEVERFVKYDELRACEQCSHDAHLLLVTGREVAYIFFLSQYLTVHKRLVLGYFLVHILLRHARNLTHKLQIFLRCKEVDKEAAVNVRSRERLPVLAHGRIDVCRFCAVRHVRRKQHASFVGIQKVENKAEERGLSRSVVSHESENLSVMDVRLLYVHGCFGSEHLLKVSYFYFHLLSPYYVCLFQAKLFSYEPARKSLS